MGLGPHDSSATGSTNRGNGQLEDGEAKQADVQEPAVKPPQSLDKVNGDKRKRPVEPVAGSGEADIHGNSKDDETEQQPGKIRRTKESEDFTSQVAGHSNTARPYEYQGGNVFAEHEAARKAGNISQQPLPKTPIPITNSTGTFKVPSPGDSDWSDSGSEEEKGNNTGLEELTPSRTNKGGFSLANPRYPPFKVPGTPQISRPSEYDALRKARAKVQQGRPRNPGRLSQPSRAYLSPPLPSEAADRHDSDPQEAGEPSHAVNSEPTGRTNFTAFEDWCKTAPPSVTAALGKMDVDSNLAGQTFDAAVNDPRAERTNEYNSFKEWSETASLAVTAALDDMDVDSNFAGQAFKLGLDKFIESR